MSALVDTYRECGSDAEDEKVADKLEAEATESARVFAKKASELGLSDRGAYVTVGLPSGPGELQKVPESRRRKLRAHLDRAFSLATSNESLRAETTVKDDGVGDQPFAAELTSLSCGLCKGGCCTQGGDRAYLSPATIRRILDSLPDTGAPALLERYLDAIPHRSERDSCIYHAEVGCSLPGELRAKLCHRFYCEPLKSLLRGAESQVLPSTLLALTRSQDDHHSERVGLPNEVTQVAVFTRSNDDDTWRRQD